MDAFKLSQDLWSLLQNADPNTACEQYVVVAIWANGAKASYGPVTTSSKKSKRKLLKELQLLVHNLEEDLKESAD
jgi:hypothetical protein